MNAARYTWALALIWILGCDGDPALLGDAGDRGGDATVRRDAGDLDAGEDRDAGPFDWDANVSPGELPAFPGAEGFGAQTPGGRGGRVVVVSTLAWDGPGSLSEALSATEPRVIVFAVSGVIEVDYGVRLTEANSYVTVAGQTAPGGITLTGDADDFISSRDNFHDAVFRFLRFRGRGSYDNVQLHTAHHVVFDHCDFSGGTDETFDSTYSHDVTIQWSTISNSDSAGQNYGSLIAYSPTARYSIHHNMFAHHMGRCAPHMHWSGGVPAEGAPIEFTNNVVYNCGFDGVMYQSGGEGGGNARIAFNLISNYLLRGPDTPAEAYAWRLPPGASVYERDTVYPGQGTWPSWEEHVDLTEPVAGPAITTQSASEAFELVLRRVGAFPRDAMNDRTVQDARSGGGRMGRLDDALLETARAAPSDGDRDGMPDAWEAERDLDPTDPSDAATDRDGDGYTNVEEYLNYLAASLIPA